MPRYLLHHRHEPVECGPAFAAWKGFDSPLRHHPALGSCLQGGHAIWWDVQASDVREALALLPPYIADRTTVAAVSDVAIP
jgi:hypothetical protein